MEVLGGLPSRRDHSVFMSLETLHEDVRRHVYYGGFRLLKATAKVFWVIVGRGAFCWVGAISRCVIVRIFPTGSVWPAPAVLLWPVPVR